jgi:hypothetical protein
MPSSSEKEKLTRSGLRSRLNLPVSIDDLRDKEFAGKSLTEEEKRALENFDQFRVEYLEKAEDDEDFQRRYFQLRSWANLNSYEDFL